MQILVDENIPRRTVVRLRELGHDVLDIRGTLREGMKDELLWELAQKEERLLISTDRRFLRYWKCHSQRSPCRPAVASKAPNDPREDHADPGSIHSRGVAGAAGRGTGHVPEHSKAADTR